MEPTTKEFLLKRHAEVVKMQSSLDMPVTMQTEYYTSDGTELGIDIWRPNPEAFPGTRPGILFFFGGGFAVGTRKLFQKHCEIIATQGYVAMTADYRIRALHGTTARESHIDGARAWQFVREHAERWSLDKDRIILAGESAGGMIAAMCGRLSGVEPMGLILFNPGMLDKEKGPETLAQLTGTEVDGIPVLNAEFAKEGDPPVLLFHGEKDTTVPIDNSRAYVDYAKAQGVDVSFVAFPDGVHGLSGYNSSRTYFHLIMGEMLLFVNRLNGIDSSNKRKR